jgi:light-regulated signal transduction histidine kinase (bacteriophytochrome)
MKNKELEKYKKYVGDKLSKLGPIFAKASIGDFSQNVEIPDEEDEFIELYVGIQMVMEVIREKISELEDLNRMLEQKVEERTQELKKSNELLRKEITKRRKAQEILKQKMVELKRSNKELENFAYIAAHDLQEPLRAVTGYVQLLEKRYKYKLDSNASEFIRRSVNATIRMKEFIDSLLAYSRITIKGKEFQHTNCEIVLERAKENLYVAIKENDAIITNDPLPAVMADETQLVQLLQNLIENAIKFRSKDQPHIYIRAESKNSEWVFSVRDNGIGISKEYYEKIFMIFQRLHIREQYQGTGIGLAVCKKIVERHGGKIWVESELEKGSTFYFTIPNNVKDK